MNISIVISTYGSEAWKDLALKRAIPSAEQFGVPVIYNHIESAISPAEARNMGLYQAETEFIAFLDADDELEPSFLNEIEKLEGDLIVPSIRYMSNGKHYAHIMPKVGGHQHACVGDCLRFGNWIVVGAVARTELLREVGGWRPYANLEDFDLWQRCWIAGAKIVSAPAAVYRAHYSQAGRNTSMPAHEYRQIQYDISKTNIPNEDWSWLLK